MLISLSTLDRFFSNLRHFKEKITPFRLNLIVCNSRFSRTGKTHAEVSAGTPFFFPFGENVNTEVYLDLIETKFIPWLKETVGEDFGKCWLQQDGARPHTSKKTIQKLKEIFGDQLISQNTDFKWPPRSPDLNTPDFFGWGYLKDNVYRNSPKTMTNLMENIENQVKLISLETLVKVSGNFEKRLQVCCELEGGYLETLV